MNYDTPPSRFGVIGVDVIPRGNVHYLHEPVQDIEIDQRFDVLPLTVEITAHDELTELIHTIAIKDVEAGDIVSLLQPETAVRRALDVYDIYVSDTTLRPETAVSEYLYAFTEAVLDPTRSDVAPHDLEDIFSGISTFMQELDSDLRTSA